jgi:hypothetical protein
MMVKEMTKEQLGEWMQTVLDPIIRGSWAKQSSTGPKNAPVSSSRTLRGGVGVASGGLSTPLTTQVMSSGTAGSATLFGPVELPRWRQIAWSPGTKAHLKKAHLKEDDAVSLLCGKEKRTGAWVQNRSPKPPANQQCKTCVQVFQKRVMEGRYEG